jgi:hypothetical protein
MAHPSWLRPLAARLNRIPGRPPLRRAAVRPRIERLEDRFAPAVFTVTTTDDNGGVNPAPFAGTGTLRQAILDANASAGADTIQFALPDALKSPGGWWTIQPLSALPMLTDSDTIDGWSQPGAGPGLAPRVMIDGTNAGPVYGGIYLGVDCTVRGLAVGNFVVNQPGYAAAGVDLEGTDTVEGCYLGLDPTGTTAAPNVFGIADYGVGDIIGGSDPWDGNVISGNGSCNVLSRGYGVTIRGNFIGTNAAGTAAVNGTTDGLRVGFVPSDAYTSVVADNLISGNGGSGIQLSEVRHVRIAGNLIGTDVTGMHALGNHYAGIFVAGGVTDVVIGGTDPGSRNVISANGTGIIIQSDSVVVQGNYVGTDVTGAPTLGNPISGIGVGGDGCLIGGAEPGAGNLIAGNGAGSENGGVTLTSSNNLVQGNVIQDNFGAGVFVGIRAQAVGNTLTQNSIYDTHSTRTRAGLGIDILANSSDPGGVTLNDSMGHDGPNHFQNFPVLAGVTRTAGGTTVTGTLTQSVTPNMSFRIEFFANTEPGALGPDGQYYGEGKRFLGSVTTLTDANGVASITAANLSAPLPDERFIAATATNLATGDTSEFSADLAVPATPPPSSLSGLVFEDFNNDGQVDFGEKGIPGVAIALTGTDDLGNPVNQSMTTTTDGAYWFLGLRPGNYFITETQPAGYVQGIDTVGTAGGSLSATDQFSVPLGPGINGLNYNFGEQPAAGGPVQKGQAAGIGFWNNKNGQALIKALPVVTNPDGSVTSVANWLAATLPNTFGIHAGSNNLAGQSNAFVAALFQQDFVLQGVKLDAQVLATVLNVYATNATLDSTGVAAPYGFTVSGDGLGAAAVNVGSDGDAFGVANNTTMTVMDLLLATDAQSVNGVLYGGNATRRSHANDVYSAINQAGGL